MTESSDFGLSEPFKYPMEPWEFKSSGKLTGDEYFSNLKKDFKELEKYESLGKGFEESLSKLSKENPEVDLTQETAQMEAASQELQKTAEKFKLAVSLNKIVARFKGAEADLPPEQLDRVVGSIKLLEAEKSPGEELLPRVGILGDSDKIEGHQIDILSYNNTVCITFKLTASHNELINEALEKGKLTQKFPVRNDKYKFGSIAQGVYEPVSCWLIELDKNTKIYVSKGYQTEIREEYDYKKEIKNWKGEIVGWKKIKSEEVKGREVMGMIGAVKIEVSIENAGNIEKTVKKVQAALNLLKIPNCFEIPSQESETVYKEARFRWHHRLETENEYEKVKRDYEKQNNSKLLEHLAREEVFPGYFTIVDKGASQRYQKDGKIFLIHKVCDSQNLPSILKHGLLSSLERYKRGSKISGMSTEEDFNTGGADSVFLRAVTGVLEMGEYQGAALLIIDESELDRTDWYAYKTDHYGAVTPEHFQNRLPPEKFFSSLRADFTTGNEIMMRRGVRREKIVGIVVGYLNDSYYNEEYKKRVIDILKQKGVTTANGVAVDEFVMSHNDFRKKYENQ